MMYVWTEQEIYKILLQLDEKSLPFQGYSLAHDGKKLYCLGTGATGRVYEAARYGQVLTHYAIKVMGFGDKCMDSATFEETAKVQKELSNLQENIVRVYEYTQICVWLDDDNRVLDAKVVLSEEEDGDESCLRLQFMLMEKTTPILAWEKNGEPEFTPTALSFFSEGEILKLAHDIGKALSFTHKKKVLHRDIKPENIFYDMRKRKYKLGDFGIAKTTTDNMAKTMAFTKGYGAPEVIGNLDEVYDERADIYSFGMLLYVLLNGLKFPESKGYQVNPQAQYSKGYLLPRPERGSQKLYDIILKMCMYRPRDRYSNMERVMDELEKVIVDDLVYYKKTHKNASLSVGLIFLAGGMFLFRPAFMPDVLMDLAVIDYVFLFLSLFLFVKCLIRNEHGKEGIVGSVLGYYSVAVFMQLLSERFCVYAPRWGILLLLSLAYLMLFQYEVLKSRELKVVKTYFGKHILWGVFFVLYVQLVMTGMITEKVPRKILYELWGEPMIDMMVSCQLTYVGIGGLLFCTFWVVREYMLLKKQQGRR